MAATNGAALPSMIGTSGPSISTSGVVDAEAAQRRENMFGGGDQRPGFVAQHGGEFGRGDGAHIGGDFAIRGRLRCGCG